jgi:recombination protein RecA
MADVRAIKDLLKRVNKKLDGGLFSLGLDEERRLQQEFFATGFRHLDEILGGGLPLGKVIEVFGWEGVGKSTFALQMSKRVIDMGKIVLWIDFEHALNTAYVNALNMDVNMFLVSQPASGEEGLEVIRTCIDNSKDIGLVVIDSVAALGAQSELDASLEDKFIGQSAALLSRGLKGILHRAEVSRVMLLFINQLRETIGRGVVMKRTPGGHLLKFLASQRIEISVTKKVDDGFFAKFKVVKNKFSIPFRETEMRFFWNMGFSDMYSAFVYVKENEGYKGTFEDFQQQSLAAVSSESQVSDVESQVEQSGDTSSKRKEEVKRRGFVSSGSDNK